MNQEQMFAEIIARKQARTQTTQVPGQDAHEVIIEQGQDALPRSEPANDVSFRGSNNDMPVSRLHGPEVTEITQRSNQPAEEDVVEIGGCRIYPNPLLGTMEAQFTRGGTDAYVVEKNGRRLTTNEGVRTIFEGLLAEKQAKVKK